jgi:hypothetical protein
VPFWAGFSKADSPRQDLAQESADMVSRRQPQGSPPIGSHRDYNYLAIYLGVGGCYREGDLISSAKNSSEAHGGDRNINGTCGQARALLQEQWFALETRGIYQFQAERFISSAHGGRDRD